MKFKSNPPLIVKVGLLGISRRRTAVIYAVACVIAAILLAYLDWRFGLAFLIAAVWYGYSIRWVDQNDSWED